MTNQVLPSGSGVTAGDVDGDGWCDLFFCGLNSSNRLYRNHGNWRFEDITKIAGLAGQNLDTTGATFADLDGDGDLDLVCALARDTSPNPRVAHAVFINDGTGNFVEETATRFTVAGTSFYSGSNGKLMDVDYDGDLDFFAFKGDTRHFQVYLNDGTGRFTYSASDSRIFGGSTATGTGADIDVTDLDRDGSYDVWIGAAGQNPRTLINTFQSPDGWPANRPRDLTVVSNSPAGIVMSWKHPAYADMARWYKVYRSTAPQLAATDRKVIKRVAISRHQDEGFAAPITRFTTTAYLNDPDVTLVGTNNEVQFIDRTAVPGITYYYSVSHVGTENIDGVPTAEVAATIPPSGGPDTTSPTLTIISPIQQDWSAYPRIVLDYADSGSGVDLATLRVSFNRQLGTNGAPGGRAADADISDIFFRKDGNGFISALQPPLSLSNNTLVTLKASLADKAGNSTTQSVQFFVSVVAPQLPVAAIGNTATNGLAPFAIPLSGTGASDADGKIMRWEWYFGDGTTALGRNVTKTYTRGGTYTVTLLVRDTHGGVSTESRSVAVADFTILSASGAGTNFSLSFPTATNRSYTVERTASLNPAGWSTLTSVPGNGSVRTVINTNATNNQQFFRVRVD
jgi:hypothetical protein